MTALAGKVAVVTGGGWNIGRAIALRFAREGASVVVCGRRRELLEETAREVQAGGGRALAVGADVRSLDEVQAVADAALASFGTIDVLATVAGGGGTAERTDEIDPSWWCDVLRTNVEGTFHAVRAVLPTMRAARSGSILTCAGGGATLPNPGSSTAYSAAKAALCRFTDQLALELLDEGIRVNCLSPPMTWSPDTLRAVEEEERRTGAPHPGRADNRPPEATAELACWLASEASAPLTGRTISPGDDWWRDPQAVRSVASSVHASCLRLQGVPAE